MQGLSTNIIDQVVSEVVGLRQSQLLMRGTSMSLSSMLEAIRSHLAQRGVQSNEPLEHSLVIACLATHDYVRLGAALPEPSFTGNKESPDFKATRRP